MSHTFYVRGSRLCYAPHLQYRLPRLRRVRQPRSNGPVSVPLVHESVPTRSREVPLYKLTWPGREVGLAKFERDIETRRVRWSDPAGDVTIPREIVTAWTGESLIDAPGLSSLVTLRPSPLRSGTAPESIAYHLAINSLLYYGDEESELAVAGLPSRTVCAILNHTEFAIPDSRHAAISHIKWVAESHAHHPTLRGDYSDLQVRESISQICRACEVSFFRLLEDCIYDFESNWYAGSERHGWKELAHYLYLVGRVPSPIIERACGTTDLIRRWGDARALMDCAGVERDDWSRWVGYRPGVSNRMSTWIGHDQPVAAANAMTREGLEQLGREATLSPWPVDGLRSESSDFDSTPTPGDRNPPIEPETD